MLFGKVVHSLDSKSYENIIQIEYNLLDSLTLAGLNMEFVQRIHFLIAFYNLCDIFFFSETLQLPGVFGLIGGNFGGNWKCGFKLNIIIATTNVLCQY